MILIPIDGATDRVFEEVEFDRLDGEEQRLEVNSINTFRVADNEDSHFICKVY